MGRFFDNCGALNAVSGQQLLALIDRAIVPDTREENLPSGAQGIPCGFASGGDGADFQFLHGPKGPKAEGDGLALVGHGMAKALMVPLVKTGGHLLAQPLIKAEAIQRYFHLVPLTHIAGFHAALGVDLVGRYIGIVQ